MMTVTGSIDPAHVLEEQLAQAPEAVGKGPLCHATTVRGATSFRYRKREEKPFRC